MGWYFVTKKIKGYRYLYQQRTWREGKRVRTESHYIGVGGTGAPQGSPLKVKSLDRWWQSGRIEISDDVIYCHGSREGFTNSPKPSESGVFGAGFYITVRENAEVYAQYVPWKASIILTTKTQEWKKNNELESNDRVYTYNIRNLELLTLTRDGYKKILKEDWANYKKDQAAPATEEEDWLIAEAFRERLEEQGFDGIEVLQSSSTPYQIVVFPDSLPKLRALPRDAEYTLNLKKGKEVG